ncbi:MAG: penicillin acylase family protein, partial [Planctomycetota bacterium]|nr:penicillin acylase family protein [Planctomycetota bacterium]
MKRFLKLAAILIVVLVAIGTVGLWTMTRRGQPKLEGKMQVEGLGAAVTVERDDHGVPRILSADARDATRALGFLHGQDRFFQMDLLRRRAAGELAALFGEPAVGADTRVRVHRLRARARAALELATDEERRELAAYTQGVNAGLETTGAPFEHRLLRLAAVPWRAEDSILVVYAMYVNLQDENAWLDEQRGVLRDTLPEPVVAFLLPAGSEWDAPLLGEAFETPPIPGPEHWDARAGTEGEAKAAKRFVETGVVLGSNNWAVSGAVSADGRAWVANDMHLGLGLPHIWYR